MVWHGYEVSVCREKQCVLIKEIKEAKPLFQRKYAAFNMNDLRAKILESIDKKDYNSCLINSYILNRISQENIRDRERFLLCKNLLMKK